MANEKFERTEKKFWMNTWQYEQIKPVLSEHMEMDKFGHSKIRNIYCDSDDYVLIRKSLEHPKFKEKLRIRSYSGFESDAPVFVEIKRKVLGIGYKRRIEVPFEQAKQLLSGKRIDAGNTQIEHELEEFIKRCNPKPKVYLTYERTAMTGKDDAALRITLDRDLRYRLYNEKLDFRKEGIPVMEDESMVLMEVKAPGCMPGWLIDILSELRIYQTSFSKIGTCFTKYIAPDLNIGSLAYREPIRFKPGGSMHMIFPRTVNL